MEDYKFLFKVVLVGNAGVGKTCLVRRFTQGLFPPGQGATIGVDFMIKTVEVDNEKVKLQIWDTAGQERFRSITQSYYRSAHALILVYDISCQPTFDCLPDWLREIEEYASTKVLRVLVGNKTDREDREIPTHVGEEFARCHDMYYLETSAKEADNVERLFMEIAAELIEHDGTPAHSSHQVTQHLNLMFPGRWISRHGHVSWPPRSSDLTPLDICLWGWLKGEVFKEKVNTRADLIIRIMNSAALIKECKDDLRRATHDLIKKSQKCIGVSGGIFESQL